jgi:dihydrofolate synthase/folylpolyglutamate synthase
LETGLGGRLDATNVIARPALTVITPVSVDHVGFLGDTVEKIAFEKAGILKLGVPAVIGRQGPKALAVIEARAAELGAPVHRLGREWSVASGPGDAGLAFAFDGASESFPAPGLVGSHQYDNAGTALAALSLLARHPGGPSVPHPAIGAGLTQVEWPARLQRLADGPISEIPPAGWELWLDGGHNTAAAEALAAASAAWSDRPLYLVMGMMRTKDPVPFLAHLAPHASGLRAVPIPGHDDCFDPAELARHAEGASLCAAAAVGVTAAIADLARAHRQAPGGDAPARVLICGSLYLAGNVLRSSG